MNNILTEHLGSSYVIDEDNLVEAFCKHRTYVFSYLEKYTPPHARKDPVKNILVCTDQTGWLTGHFGSVVKLTEQLNNLGYNAILCLAENHLKEKIPKNIECTVNPLISSSTESYRNRIANWRKICTDYSIDTVILNSWQSSYKYWDLLALHNLFPEAPENRVRVLLHFHNSFAKVQFELGSNWLRNNTPAIKLFDALIAISEVDAAFWSTFHTRVFCRPLPIEYNPSSNSAINLTQKEHLAIYIARFSEQKNQMDAVEVFKRVTNILPDAKLVMAGNDVKGYRVKVQQHIKKLGLTKNIEILDFVSGNDKNYLFNTAACALNTSIYEGFPQYLCEAKSHGLPIVAFNLPNLTIFDGAEENGVLLAPQGKYQQLAEQIIRVMANNDLQYDLSNAARKHAAQLASFDYSAFWATVFDNIRNPIPYLKDFTMQERIYATIFDALYYASKHKNAEDGKPLCSIASEWGKSKIAVLAVASSHTTAISALSLAGSLNAPLIFTEPNSLSLHAAAELSALGAKTVYIVGLADSTNSIQHYVGLLKKIKRTIAVVGTTPSDLAITCARTLKPKQLKTVIIATQNNFKDTVSIGPYVYANASPVLLLEQNKQLSSTSLEYIQKAGFKQAIILGGPVVIPVSVEKQLHDCGISEHLITRLAGSNEYKTNHIISSWATGVITHNKEVQNEKDYQYTRIAFPPSIQLQGNLCGVATTESWQNAFMGAALCGKNKSVLVLADKGKSTFAYTTLKHLPTIKSSYFIEAELGIVKMPFHDLMNKLEQI